MGGFPQSKIVAGYFTAAGTPVVVNVDLGFIPDYVKLVGEGAAAADISIIEWFGEDTKALKHTVIADNGATGSKNQEWITSGGPSKIDSAVQFPKRWTASTAWVVGDVVAPTTLNGYFYRCSSAGTGGASEPTWGTTVGGNTTDSGATFVCVAQGDEDYSKVRIVRRQGFSVPAALQKASTKIHFLAIRGEKVDYTNY
jgi:hypothetical protein